MSSRKLTEELKELENLKILESAFARLPPTNRKIDSHIKHNLLNKTTLDTDMDLFIQEIIEPVVSMRKSMLDYLNMLHYFLIDTNPEEWTVNNSKANELQLFALDLYDQIKNKIHISDHLESEVTSAYPDLDKRNTQKITEKLRKFLNNDTTIELKLSHLAPYIYYEYYKVHKDPEEVQVLFYNTTNFYGLLKSLAYIVDNY